MASRGVASDAAATSSPEGTVGCASPSGVVSPSGAGASPSWVEALAEVASVVSGVSLMSSRSPAAGTSAAATTSAASGTSTGSDVTASDPVGAAPVSSGVVASIGCCNPSAVFSVLDTAQSLPRAIGDTPRVSTDDAPARPVAVAFCPHPPLLLPVLEGAPVPASDRLRIACAEAVATALTIGPDVVLVVGDGPAGVRYGPGDAGDLQPWGGPGHQPFDARVRPGGRSLPLAHTIAAWLLDRAGYDGIRLGVAPDDLTAALADLPGPVALLAMGDGSARRTEKAPGYLDPAAAAFDAAVAAALTTGDAAALAGLDAAEGRRLLAAGTGTWRAVGAALAGRSVTARLLLDDAPFGVGYLVADWLLAGVPDRVPGWLTA